jgi:hypothetical protein
MLDFSDEGLDFIPSIYSGQASVATSKYRMGRDDSREED